MAQPLDIGIEDLNIGASGALRLTVRATLLDKGRTIPSRGGPLDVFAVYFVDRDGAYIYHECLGKDARRVSGQIRASGVYQISGFVVGTKKPARLSFSLAGPLVLDLSRAQITPVADDKAIPTRVPPAALGTLLALGPELGSTKRTQPVCVEGIVEALENVRAVETARGRTEVRNFELRQGEVSIAAACWGALAASPQLRGGAELYFGDIDLKVLDGGASRKLDSRVTTVIHVAESAIHVGADATPMTARGAAGGLKRRYSAEDAHYTTCALADTLVGGEKREGLSDAVLHVRSVQLEDVPAAPLPMYQACELCGKKADSAGVCSGSAEHGRATAWRWIGRLRIRDGTSTIEVTIFNDVAETVLGKPAADAAARVEAGHAPFTPVECSAARNNLWDGLIIIEQDEFRGENKLTLVRARVAEPLTADMVRDLRRIRPCPARGPRWPHTTLADVNVDSARQTIINGAVAGGLNLLVEALDDGIIEREEATSAVVTLRVRCDSSKTEAELRVCGPLGACSPLIKASKGDIYVVGCRMMRPGRLILDRMRKVADADVARAQHALLTNAAKQDGDPISAATLESTPKKRNMQILAETPSAGTPFTS